MRKNLMDIISSKPNEFFVAEYVREACIKYLSVELPYSLHVEINKFEDEKNLISVAATIFLKKNSHLSIVIGKNGSMLVKISKFARINSEKLFNKKVYLKIFVKYDPRWKNSESFFKFIQIIWLHQIFIFLKQPHTENQVVCIKL